MSGCSESIPGKSAAHDKITQATWDDERQVLLVAGEAVGDQSSLTVSNASTKQEVGVASIQKNKSWQVQLSKPAVVPCRVSLANSNGVAVDNAPANCDQATRSNVPVTIGRAVSQMAYPEGTITRPSRNVTIAPGDVIEFAALGSETRLIYQWDISSDTFQYTTKAQNPGFLKFSQAGKYRVVLTVTNAVGVKNITPEQRIINVRAPGANLISVISPVASIDAPMGDSTINVGDSLTFSSSATDPNGSGLLTYAWDFAGAMSNSTAQNPGNITFVKAGVFTVQLTVKDGGGITSQNVAQVVITVLDNGANQAPSGIISSPAIDVTIPVGGSVEFIGGATDPDGDVSFTYLWDIPGVSLDVVAPGTISFPNAGVYPVSLLVTDSLGLADPNPPTRVVTAVDAAVNNSDFPTATILEPAADVTIVTGDSVIFNGEAASPGGVNDPVTVEWSMVDADPASTPTVFSTVLMPGPTPFDMAGVYTITLTATDAAAQTNQTPTQVVVTVNDPPPAELNGIIVMPEADITIEVGATVDFEGDGIDPLDEGLVYDWSFADPNIPDALDDQEPSVTFDTEGVYVVALTVTDDSGAVDATPAELTVTVEAAAAAPPADPAPPPVEPAPNPGAPPTTPAPPPVADPAPPPPPPAADDDDDDDDAAAPPPADPNAPTGIIESPAADMVVVVGDVVDFIGGGTDPNAEVLTFMWTFSGAAPDSSAQSPGVITFDTVGSFDVVLTVTNASGLVDPIPPMVNITVQDAAAPPATPAPASPTLALPAPGPG